MSPPAFAKSQRPPCTAITRAGQPCKLWAMPGRVVCRYHSPDPADIARRLDESRRGGEARGVTGMTEVSPLVDDAGMQNIDLTTATGVRDYLAAALRALARLPFSVKVASAVAQLATAQRQGIETSDLEQRLTALERGNAPGLQRVR